MASQSSQAAAADHWPVCLEQCAICSLHADPDRLSQVEIWRNSLWLLRHHPDPSPLLGWCLLDARRHLAGPIDFENKEAHEWGKVVQQASKLIQQITRCDRVYAIAFGEGARHLHLHLIPRFQSDPRTAAWSVANLYRDVEEGRDRPVEQHRVQDFLIFARRAAQTYFET